MSRKNGTDVIEAEYHLHSEAPGSQNNSAESARSETASFVTAFSVPAIADQREGTQFCWLPRTSSSANDPTGTAPAGAAHCTAFTLNGNEIQIPPDGARLEIRTPGRPTLAIEWTAGRVTIQQKLYSARILLEFPAGNASNSATTAANDVSYVVRYIVERTP
jgi:hypothetical protein